MVFTFYDLCANLWGGSPAITTLPFRVDTSGQNDDNESEGNKPQSPIYFPQNRDRKDRKDKKMPAKLSTESQLLQISCDNLDFTEKLLEIIDESDKEFRAGFTELNKTMSTIGTAIQQSFGILGQLVGQGMSNHMRMLSPQTYQDQMHQHQIKYISNKCTKVKLPINNEGHNQQLVRSLVQITIIITQRMFLVGMISWMSTMLMKRNIKICRNRNFFLNDSFVVLLQS